MNRTGVFAVAINPSAAEGKADSLIVLMKLALMTPSGVRQDKLAKDRRCESPTG